MSLIADTISVKVDCLDVFVFERKRRDLVLALRTSAKPSFVEGLALKDGEQLSKPAPSRSSVLFIFVSTSTTTTTNSDTPVIALSNSGPEEYPRD